MTALRRVPVDAIPDLSDTQVIVRTSYPGKPPQVVEDLVTYPLTTTLLGALAAEVTARAVVQAVRAARGLAGAGLPELPSLHELPTA